MKHLNKAATKADLSGCSLLILGINSLHMGHFKTAWFSIILGGIIINLQDNNGTICT